MSQPFTFLVETPCPSSVRQKHLDKSTARQHAASVSHSRRQQLSGAKNSDGQPHIISRSLQPRIANQQASAVENQICQSSSEAASKPYTHLTFIDIHNPEAIRDRGKIRTARTHAVTVALARKRLKAQEDGSNFQMETFHAERSSVTSNPRADTGAFGDEPDVSSADHDSVVSMHQWHLSSFSPMPKSPNMPLQAHDLHRAMDWCTSTPLSLMEVSILTLF